AFLFFFSSRRRHTRSKRDWSSDVCSSDLGISGSAPAFGGQEKLIDALWVARLGGGLLRCRLQPGLVLDRAAGVNGPASTDERVKIGRASCRERGRSAAEEGRLTRGEA